MEINNSKDLDNAIALLRDKKKSDVESLKTHFNDIVDSLKPKNLIKSAFKNATEGTSTGGLLLKTVAGIGGSLLNSNLKFGRGNSLITIASNNFKSGVANSVLKNADKIIAWGTAIFNSFNKKNTINDKSKRIENVVDQYGGI